MTEPPRSSLPASYFEDVYRANPDPWGFETSPYEAAKYTATLAALPRPRYRSGFEPGCSIGVLTERLAARCDALLAVDLVPAVLARAAERCRHLAQVRLAVMPVPERFPDDRFDLIVLSEVGYYWARSDLDRARRLTAAALEPAGHLLLVHWTPLVPDYPLTGDEVHDAFLEDAGDGKPFIALAERREERYRLDLLERR